MDDTKAESENAWEDDWDEDPIQLVKPQVLLLEPKDDQSQELFAVNGVSCRLNDAHGIVSTNTQIEQNLDALEDYANRDHSQDMAKIQNVAPLAVGCVQDLSQQQQASNPASPTTSTSRSVPASPPNSHSEFASGLVTPNTLFREPSPGPNRDNIESETISTGETVNSSSANVEFLISVDPSSLTFQKLIEILSSAAANGENVSMSAEVTCQSSTSSTRADFAPLTVTSSTVPLSFARNETAIVNASISSSSDHLLQSTSGDGKSTVTSSAAVTIVDTTVTSTKRPLASESEVDDDPSKKFKAELS